MIIGDLPKFFAVSTDLETFIELSTDDIRGCKKLERLICNFHTGLGKRWARKSCAISLFTNDANRKLTQFRQQFKEWKGSEVAYLGENRWAFSAITAHEVVFSCPIGSSKLLFYSKDHRNLCSCLRLGFLTFLLGVQQEQKTGSFRLVLRGDWRSRWTHSLLLLWLQYDSILQPSNQSPSSSSRRRTRHPLTSSATYCTGTTALAHLQR